MSATRAWDRAGLVPVPADGSRSPEVAGLGEELPTVAELFTFMRDAELRFSTLRMRIEERTWTTRGEDLAVVDVMLRHPGNARVLTTRPGEGLKDRYEVWVTDGTTVREYIASRKVGTRRPVRPAVRGTDGRDLPGRSRVYRAVTPLQMESLPELFIHPAGYSQNVLGTGSCRVTGSTEVAGREAIVLECDHPRTIELAADRPDFSIRIAVDRLDGVILRLEESIGGQVTRDAAVTAYQPNAPLPPNAFEFAFPSDTTFIY
jgi:outer membrane lipoprotein-sorting protein